MNNCIDICVSSKVMKNGNCENSKRLASDALLYPVGSTNKVFFVLFFSSAYEEMEGEEWDFNALYPLRLGELVAIVVHLASFIYFLGILGIDCVQDLITSSVERR